MGRGRLRDLGVAIGTLPPGRLNAITDVAPIRVGMVTLIEDRPHVVRSGLTLISPHIQGRPPRGLFAATHVLNGNGEMTGLAWIEEFGLLTGPAAITGTYSIGAVHEGMVALETELDEEAEFKLPLVTETYDGWLSDAASFPVRPHHVRSAFEALTDGPVEEGNVGGGTGMNAHGFKAGTGTSSRMAHAAGRTWTVGVLVQANYGRRERLMLDGIPVGRAIPSSEVSLPWPEPNRADGSIIVVVATDAPLLPIQLRRLAQRAGLGVARVGGLGEPGSGDLFIAFSTAVEIDPAAPAPIEGLAMLPDFALGELMQATVEATEEAIWNALVAAETMTGWQGRVSHAIPLDRLKQAIGI